MHNLECRKSLYLSLIFFLSVACQGFWQQNSTIYETCPKPPQCEYNPQKAGAEIVKRINAPNGLYTSYTNHHLYLVSTDKISIFDLSSDDILIVEEFVYQLEDFYHDVTKDYCRDCLSSRGIIDQNGKLLFILRAEQWFIPREDDYIMTVWLSGNVYRYFNAVLCLDRDSKQLSYADLSEDINFNNNTDNIFYNNNEQMLYVAEKVSEPVNNVYKPLYNIFRYPYSTNVGSLYDKNLYDSGGPYGVFSLHIYLTNDYMISSYYDIRSTGVVIYSDIYISKIKETKIFKTINLIYLNLRYPPLSAFSDDKGNIWLYVREYDSETQQDKYELLKLKLL